MPSAYESVVKDSLDIQTPTDVRSYSMLPSLGVDTACLLRFLADRWEELGERTGIDWDELGRKVARARERHGDA